MDLLAGWYEVLFILVSNSSYVFWLFRGKFGPFPLLCSFLFRLICDYLPTYESLPRGRSINSVGAWYNSGAICEFALLRRDTSYKSANRQRCTTPHDDGVVHFCEPLFYQV